MRPHATNTHKDCPCKGPWQLRASRRAHSRWQNRNRRDKTWEPSTLFSLWLYGYQDWRKYSGCFPPCYLHPGPFKNCSEAGCHDNGCFRSCLPSNRLLLAEEPVPDACQAKLPSLQQVPDLSHPQATLAAWWRVFSLCPHLCPRLDGRKFRTGELDCRFAAPIMFVTLLWEHLYC